MFVCSSIPLTPVVFSGVARTQDLGRTFVYLFMNNIPLVKFYMGLGIAPLPSRHGVLDGDKAIWAILCSEVLGILRIRSDQVGIIDVHLPDFINALLIMSPRISSIKVVRKVIDEHPWFRHVLFASSQCFLSFSRLLIADLILEHFIILNN